VLRPLDVLAVVFIVGDDIEAAVAAPLESTNESIMPTEPNNQQHVPREPTSPVELAAALRSVGDEARSSAWNRSFTALATAVEAGMPLDEAVRATTMRLPRGTDALLLATAGSGRTGAVLAGLGDHNRRRAARREELVSIFAYPSLVLLLAAVVGVVVFLYVRPEITTLVLGGTNSMIEEIALHPWVSLASRTRLMDSQWLHASQPWPLVIGFGGLLGVCGLGVATRRAAPAVFDRLVGWSPLVGELFRQAAQEEWCRLVSLLVTLGRPLDEATDAATAMLRAGDVADRMRAVSQQLRGGESLTGSLAAHSTFPATATTIVAWGETNNQIAGALSAVADLLADQVSARMEMLKNVMVPLIFVLVAGLAISFLACVLDTLLPLIWLIESLS
jgi:type IV pilus assembly protein PilC